MTAQPPGLRRTPPALRRLFGPLLPLPEGAIWSVGRFRCSACDFEPEPAEPAPTPPSRAVSAGNAAL